MIGKKVIVRATNAGVFFGTLKEQTDRTVTLTNFRKIYYWDGAAAVEEISLNGVTKPENCKFTVWNEIGVIKDWNQIIPCSEKSIKIIEGVKEWKIKK